MKTVIFGADGGLGDRLFTMASGLRLAKLLGRKPIFWWAKTNFCKAKFEELFEPFNNLEVLDYNIDKILFSNTELYIHKKNLKKNNLGNLPIPYYIKPSPHLKQIFIHNLICYLSKEKKFFKNENFKRKVDEEIKNYLRKLKPIKELRKKIENFAKTYFDENTVSIHLRRTDLPIWLLGTLPTDKEIIKMLKEYLQKNPRTKFFLATDSKETEYELKKELKNKIITYPKKNWVKKKDKNKSWRKNIYRSKNSVKDSVIELFLLSKNRIFLKFNKHAGYFNRLPPILNPNQKVIILKSKEGLLKKLNSIFKKCLWVFDSWIGLAGIFLKDNFPKLYFKLKNRGIK